LKGGVQIKSKKISNKLTEKRELKMAKARNRINKMHFQKQARRCEPLEPLSEDDKYIVQMSGYKKGLRTTNEKIPRYANSSG
jgi:hypothetical protein